MLLTISFLLFLFLIILGAYSPEARRERIERFLAKRDKRVWTKKVKYDVRKNFADSRLRVKVRKEEESVYESETEKGKESETIFVVLI